MADRIELKSLKAAFDLLKDKELEDVYSVFKKNFSVIKFTGIYSSVNEVREELKSRMIGAFSDEYRELRSKVSRLRKKGKEVTDIDFSLLEMPLKLKLFSAEFNVKNYELVYEILKKSKDDLKQFDEDEIDRRKEVVDAGREKGFKEMVKVRRKAFGLVHGYNMNDEGEIVEVNDKVKAKDDVNIKSKKK